MKPVQVIIVLQAPAGFQAWPLAKDINRNSQINVVRGTQFRDGRVELVAEVGDEYLRSPGELALPAWCSEKVQLVEVVWGRNDFLWWRNGLKEERSTHTLLDLASRILPRKVVAEYIGDREEVLRRMAEENCPRWKLQLEAASCVFWAVVFTLRKFVAPAAILGALGKWLGM